MVSNCEYIRTTAGTLKSVSIVFITITLILSSLAHFTSNYTKDRDSVRPLIGNKTVNLWREIYQVSAACICFVVSVANLCVHLISRETYWNRKTGIYDFVYHAGSFLMLSSAGLLNMISAVKVFEINCTTENECQNFELKLAASGLALVASLVCGVIAAVVLTNRKDVERDWLFTDEK